MLLSLMRQKQKNTFSASCISLDCSLCHFVSLSHTQLVGAGPADRKGNKSDQSRNVDL